MKAKLCVRRGLGKGLSTPNSVGRLRQRFLGEIEFSCSIVKGEPVVNLLQQLWNEEQGQDIAEYAVMLAVILVIVVGTIRLIGSNANNVFSSVGSAIQ